MRVNAWAIVAGIGLLLPTANLTAQRPLPDDLVGHWAGVGQIAVAWTNARTIAVDLTIKPDGEVVGVVGDARLADGRVRRSRRWLGRLLRLKTDWMISGTLDGALLAQEGTVRDRVNIGLNKSKGTLEGGLTTSGRLAGGAEEMSFAAGKLVLRRVESGASQRLIRIL